MSNLQIVLDYRRNHDTFMDTYIHYPVIDKILLWYVYKSLKTLICLQKVNMTNLSQARCTYHISLCPQTLSHETFTKHNIQTKIEPLFNPSLRKLAMFRTLQQIFDSQVKFCRKDNFSQLPLWSGINSLI